MKREDELIGWLRTKDGTALVGDDAALLPLGKGTDRLVATSDSQLGGVHVPPDLDPSVLGRRLTHVNLSDLAAVGAEPLFALTTLATPERWDRHRFFDGVLEELAAVGAVLAGGDLARSAVPAATMTLLGRPHGDGLVGRGAARPGDRLWVGAPLGESAAGRHLLAAGARLTADGERGHIFLPLPFRLPGARAETARAAILRHLTPRARLDVGRWLAGRERAAAIDVSDGFSLDLARLCRASGVGARVERANLPLAPGFEELCEALEREPLDLVLGGGEDYVLLFALPEGEEPPEELECVEVGRVTALEDGSEGGSGPETGGPSAAAVEAALVLVEADGTESFLPVMGWDHLENADDAGDAGDEDDAPAAD